MRSIQEEKPSLAKGEAAPESLSGVKTESQSSESSLAKNPSTASVLSENFSESQTWENKDSRTWSLMGWVSEAQALEDQTAKPQASETQAFETQRRDNQSEQTSGLEVEAVSVQKQKLLLKTVEVPKKKKREVPFIRPVWSNKFEYLLAQVGYSMRAVNLWRFPHLWLHNGGWSFFIIYIFLLFLIGIPLLFLEMAAGQRMRQGSIGVWKIIGPWFGGLGYTSFMVCLIASLYLNVVNAWTLSYLGQSFQYSVPWEHCPLPKNSSDFDPECARTTPSTYFWYRTLLNASDRIEDGGPPVFHLSLPLLLSWCLVGAVTINGLKCIGKVMYVLVPMSYFIMFCFLIRTLLLDGAAFGLQYFTLAKISAIYNMSVWCRAGVQVLLALGLGYGSTVSLSSHMNLSNNCLRDAFTVALTNLGSMILATPSVFCVLGFWARIVTKHCNEKNTETILRLIILGKLPPEIHPPLNQPDNTVFTNWLNNLSQPVKGMVLSYTAECNSEKQLLKVKEAPNFAFLAFIEAMSFSPGSVFWSILFFLLLLTLGLSVTVGVLLGIVTPLQDAFSSFGKYKKLLTVVGFVLMFPCGLFFIQPSGIYYVGLLSEHWMVLPVITVVIFENMAVAWAYGARRFLADLAVLWNHPIHPIFYWLWCYLSPVVLLALFTTTLTLLSLKTITYVAWDSNSSKEVLRQYPSWGLLVMIALFLTVIFPIPTYFVYCLTRGIPFRSCTHMPHTLSGCQLNLTGMELEE